MTAGSTATRKVRFIDPCLAARSTQDGLGAIEAETQSQAPLPGREAPIRSEPSATAVTRTIVDGLWRALQPTQVRIGPTD